MGLKLGLLFLFAVVLGWGVTGGMRCLVLRTGILDSPNSRSSHTRPTPTLGGIGIVAGVWGALGMGSLLDCALPFFWKAMLGSSVVLLFLIYDDIRPMGRLSKLAVQVSAGLVMMASGVVLRSAVLPWGGEVALGWAAYPLTFLWLVGLQNFFNFMDGIDGIVGFEGLVVAGLIGGLAVGFSPWLSGISAVLIGAILGFLWWNAPPARIFMGDVGAHFLGLAFGVLAVVGEGEGIPFWVSVLFMGAFLFDTIYTIFRRLFRGENITLAHRFHLYQRLIQLRWGHGRVDAVFVGFTLLLGAVGYLHLHGYPALSLASGCGAAVLTVGGTVWVERRWQRAQGEARG